MVDDEEEDSKMPAVSSAPSNNIDDDDNLPSPLVVGAAAVPIMEEVVNNDDEAFEFSMELEFDDGSIKQLVAAENLFLENYYSSNVVIVGSSEMGEAIHFVKEFAEETGASTRQATNTAAAPAGSSERRESGMMSNSLSPTTEDLLPGIDSMSTTLHIGGHLATGLGVASASSVARYKTTDDDDDDDGDSDGADDDGSDDDDDDDEDDDSDDDVPDLVEGNFSAAAVAADATASAAATASLNTNDNNASSSSANRLMSFAERQRLIGVVPDRYLGEETSRFVSSSMYHDIMHIMDSRRDREQEVSDALAEVSSSLSSQIQRLAVSAVPGSSSEIPAVAAAAAAAAAVQLPANDVVNSDTTDEGRSIITNHTSNVIVRTTNLHRMNRFPNPNSTFGTITTSMTNPRAWPVAYAAAEAQEGEEAGQQPAAAVRLVSPPSLEHTSTIITSSRINNSQPLRMQRPAPSRMTGMTMRHLSEMSSHMNMLRQREFVTIIRSPPRMEEIMTPMNTGGFIQFLNLDTARRAGSCDSSESNKESEPQIPLHKLECLSCDNNRRAEPPNEETRWGDGDGKKAKAIADAKRPLTENDPDDGIKLIRICCLRPIPSVVFKRLAGNLVNLREIHVCDHWENLSDEFGCRRPDMVVNQIFGCEQLMKSLQKLVIRCSFEELHHTYLRNLEELELLRCHDLQRVRIITNATYTSNKLRRLHLRYCQSTQALKDLLHIFPNIKELHLEACNADLSQIDFGKLLPKLESLKICLAMNVISLFPPSSTTATEQSYGLLPKLHELKIEYMANLDIESLMMFISKCCPKLKELSLRDDRLADQDLFEKSLDGLCGIGPSLLRTLRLGWNNDITRSTLNCRMQHEKIVKILKTHGQLYRIEIMGDVMDGCPTPISPSPYGRYRHHPSTQRLSSALSALLQSNAMYENGRIRSLLKQNYYAIPFIGMQKYIKLWPNFIAAIGGKKTGKANTKANTDGKQKDSKPDILLQANCIYNFLRKDPTLTGHNHHRGHHLLRREHSFISRLVQHAKERRTTAAAVAPSASAAEVDFSAAEEVD